MLVFPKHIRSSEYFERGIMASLSFSKVSLTIHLNGRERRALGRPNLVLEKSRLKSAELADLPGKESLGMKTSKFSLFSGSMGEYRTNSKRVLVLGSSKTGLLIKLSHPSIDEVWFCGSQAKELEQQINNFIQKA